MIKYKTSVLILTRNRAHLLTKNLESLTRQQQKPDEVIIIDNQSTDNTQKVIKSFTKKLPLKTFITDLSGFASRYNFGVSKCTKQLLCFLDDDCLPEPQWLKYLVESHRKYPNDIIQGNTYALPKGNIYAEIMGDHYQNWIKANTIGTNELRVFDNKNALIDRTQFNKVGGFSEDQNVGSEDIEFGIRFRKSGHKIIFEPEAIIWHHERDNFKAFIKQHQRIAQSEAKLDSTVTEDNKIGVMAGKKALYNLNSAVKRELVFIKQHKCKKIIQMPVIYLTLFFIRIYSYFQPHKRRILK